MAIKLAPTSSLRGHLYEESGRKQVSFLKNILALYELRFGPRGGLGGSIPIDSRKNILRYAGLTSMAVYLAFQSLAQRVP